MNLFSIVDGYAAQAGDFVLLPFLNANTPAFPVAYLPGLTVTALQKEGESKLVHFGPNAGGLDIAARAVRLDAKCSNPGRDMRIAVTAAMTEAEKLECQRVVVLLSAENGGLAIDVQEAALLGGYRFEKYLSEKKKPVPVALCVDGKAAKEIRESLKPADVVCKWVNRARDLLNEPANVLNPESFGAIIKKEGEKAGLKVELWNAERLKKEECGGILGVGAGAAKAPRLAIAEYKPKKAVCHLALVGKGVTFDTGGYCLKGSTHQIGMKMDMGGAAMMFAAASAIAELKLPIRLTLLTPLVENAISQTAYRTTDILTMRSGLSVQVDNTDAEGRLILADALTLAGEKKPDYIIDAATLTGACVVALGEDIAGVFGTDSVLTGQILDAAEEAGECMWQLPLHQAYAEALKTTIADCKNIGGSWGGAITAALFLQKFVPEGQKWAHIDIAGPAMKEDAHEHLGKGAKGFGVKSIVTLASQLVEAAD